MPKRKQNKRVNTRGGKRKSKPVKPRKVSSPKTMSVLGQKVGARVRDLREANGWSQGQLAKSLGVTQARVSQLEKGTTEARLSVVMSVARVFKTSLDDVVNGTSHNKSSKAKATFIPADTGVSDDKADAAEEE